MIRAQATLSEYRQSPRKVRLVVDMIRGKRVPEALELLRFTTKRSTTPLAKLIESALANALQNDSSIRDNDLIVEQIAVDGGATLFRRRPRARGSAFTIRKRTSSIKVVLGDGKKEDKKSKTPKGATATPKANVEKTKTVEKKAVSKPAVKKTVAKKTTTKKEIK